jgi:triosephosphate isomerase (TIM)
MRKPIVAGNWKMNLTIAESRQLVAELIPGLESIEGVEKVICPPATDLLAVAALLEGTDIKLGAQNMYWETSGAFTGENSPPMIAEFCQYVIIGHSERRKYFGETDETVNLKIQSALAHSITPIVCVGETLEEYEANQTASVVTRQVREGFSGIVDQVEPGFVPFVIAYEPVWAIGTGRASTRENASAVISKVIRRTLAEMFGQEIAEEVRVLYGGSVKGDNAAEFFDDSHIDGGLVGGASLKAGDFVAITKAAIP